MNKPEKEEGAVDDRVRAVVASAAPGATISCRPCLYTTTYRIEEIEACRPGEPTERFVVKHLGREAMNENGRRAKLESMDSTGRELAVYRDLLAGAGLATPILVGGWDDGRSGALVLERVEGDPLTDVGDFGVWEAAARWLAQMHLTFVDGPAGTRPKTPTSLLHYDRDLLEGVGTRGLKRAVAQDLGSFQIRAELAKAHERALTALTSARCTLVHGDYYPSNIIVAEDRVAVVDWELAGWGPPELDLAALISGTWSCDQRGQLTRAYHEETAEAGPTESLAALVRRVRLASLHLALRWLGAGFDWRAPDEHHRDWFADAVSVLADLDEEAA